MAGKFVEVGPVASRLPGERRDGTDPLKLQRQVGRYGSSLAGMPPPEAACGGDRALVLMDGVTRATRTAKSPPSARPPPSARLLIAQFAPHPAPAD